jgi:predicted nucleic acid-binding protein
VSVFVDTSAILAALDTSDRHHGSATATWTDLLQEAKPLSTTNDVVVETIALLQHRAGLSVVRPFLDEFFPALHVHWIEEAQHAAAVAELLATDRRQVSLVDCTSFLVLRRLASASAFAFDPHFAEQGFLVTPS